MCFLLPVFLYSSLLNAENFVRGVNYDPVHSVLFAKGVGTDNKEDMQQAIFNDLDKLRDLNNRHGFKIDHLKVFFTQFNSLHNKVELNIADVVHAWNQNNPNDAFTLALAVPEFQGRAGCGANCEKWTAVQIEAVKYALNKYAANSIPLIDKVIVGNEDLDRHMENRLARDITIIKNYIQQNRIQNVMVGTAQTPDPVKAMYRGTGFSGVFAAADFIGVNVYPFWGGIPYVNRGALAKNTFAEYWTSLKKERNWGVKPLIETEEGWPSWTGEADENDYFNYWLNGHTPSDKPIKPGEDYVVQTSYFFALNDKLPGQGAESTWGIFSADNSTNIVDNNSPGGKKFANNIVFPSFKNYIGADIKTQTVYNLKDVHEAIVMACTGSFGDGDCYPLDGYAGSGAVNPLNVNSRSWDGRKHGYTAYSPGVVNHLMIDNSMQHYNSLYIVMNDGSNHYPGVCWIDRDALQKLSSKSQISIIWPEQGKPEPCLIH